MIPPIVNLLILSTFEISVLKLSQLHEYPMNHGNIIWISQYKSPPPIGPVRIEVIPWKSTTHDSQRAIPSSSIRQSSRSKRLKNPRKNQYSDHNRADW